MVRPPHPDSFWLDLEEAAERLGIKEHTFSQLWKDGIIPEPGLWLSRETYYWHADVVDALGVLLGHLVTFLVEPPVKPKSPKKTGPNRGATGGEPGGN